MVSQPLLSCSDDALALEDSTDEDNDGTGTASCVVTAALTEGPYFVDERLNRSDIRSDPVTGAVSQGLLLDLTFNVSRVADSACTPLTGAYLDVWHADASGVYSDVSGAGAGRRFLRGYQITDADGIARFTTIYPGWYTGRAVHIHFKLRLFTGSTTTYEFTSQFFFDESLTDVVHALNPYSSKGRRDRLNSTDGIYNGLSTAEKAALTLRTTGSASEGLSGVIDLGVRLG
jgi:protocatechuate 3,4-dioxygenase beta subunit